MTTDAILDPHAAVLSALLEVARAAHRMVDDADVDVVATATVPGDLDALCAALDRLGEAATDAPAGYAPHPTENAAHMRRGQWTTVTDRPPTAEDGDRRGLVLALRRWHGGHRWEVMRWQGAALLGLQWTPLPEVPEAE